ncbi:MAG: glutamate 5-kinase [Planctomycetota bacterium]|nr:MAG: glutamate 5-kinase [Planctomycetota bacterium]REJ88372.1 MAG: glutamate 5-kinase [Planctomycetota bacterium]REK30666.1 MAG: glutamate 5-kinase [Planctomycetota bacterium]REK33040.1 MAG: glutamate 5-kinase [Planctomycetota bacterium]
MDPHQRRSLIESARTIVVKVGTNVLAREDDTLNTDRIHELAAQIHRIRETGRQVVVVSSGAVAAGMGILGLKQRPDDLPHLQAAAASGQARVIRHYNEALQQFGRHAAQILVTANDFRHRGRYLNIRNTIHTLFEYGVVPVINENDTVSIDEIKFGDNDRLAAMVTNLLHDPLLVILSVVDGLYDGDPGSPETKVIPLVEEWNNDLLQLASTTHSTRGMGGMRSKLEAVSMATSVGESVIIANGTDAAILDRIIAGEEVGTLFLARDITVPAWKRWIGYTIEPKGRFHLDDGAVRAIKGQGRSLLAAGMTRVEGRFEVGEVVALIDPHGREFARGLTNYNAADASSIAGKRTSEIKAVLGDVPYEEVVHRDNLVVTR